MLIPVTWNNLSFFEALASETRLKIIQTLAVEELNIKDLAQRIGLSSPIVLKHIDKLEKVGLVSTYMTKRNGSTHKMCSLLFAEYILVPPPNKAGSSLIHELLIPVGHYTLFECLPTCGLATESDVIGRKDDPRVFLLPDRMKAQLLWLSRGYVEYRMPSFTAPGQVIHEIEISFEIASEAPDFKDDWPSDIAFYFNGIKLCVWTSRGDFGEKRGVYTPAWWTSNQYGILVVLRITREGVFIDDRKVSEAVLHEALQTDAPHWTLRFETDAQSERSGGLTLFGEKFGNHNRDILIRVFWSHAD